MCGKYTYHYNGLRCLRYIAVKFAIWGEDVPNDKNSTARTCYEILCRMKDFTQEYNTVMGENPQDVDIVNEYIEKYSQAYMYILQNKDTLTDDEAYTYLHNFLFDEDMIDLQTQVYHITTENLDTFFKSNRLNKKSHYIVGFFYANILLYRSPFIISSMNCSGFNLLV